MRARQWFLPVLVVLTGVAINTQPELWRDERAISHVATTVPVIALTIDDGPHYKMTPQVLAVLKEKGARATFFVLGENVDRRPELLAKEVADGHEIAVHGYHHNSLARRDKAAVAAELERAEEAIGRVTTVKPALFRPPGGSSSATVAAAARERGYTMVLWDVDPQDWARPPVGSVVGTVMRRAAPGSIVLLHDGQYPLPTPQALAIIIDRLRAEGYELVTVSELLRLNERRAALGAL